jgi:hypothetical protein
VQDRQYHLTQGEAPPHVEERETPNRDNIPVKKRVKGKKFKPRAIRSRLVGMVGQSMYKMWIPETDSVIVTTSVKFDKYSKTSTVRPSVLPPPQSPPQSPPSHPRIGRFQPLLERLSIVEQPAPEGEDDDPALPQAGNSDDFDGFEEPHVNTPEPTRSNNVAPRREDINADFSERHIIHGPRTRRARVNFSSATFDYCFAMALVRLTTKLADLPPEPRNYKQFLNHPRRNDLQLAVDDEYNALIANSTWRPATPEEITKHKIIPGQWVWSYKGDAQGNYVKDKARMVACGNRQKESI